MAAGVSTVMQIPGRMFCFPQALCSAGTSTAMPVPWFWISYTMAHLKGGNDVGTVSMQIALATSPHARMLLY